jgi:hypothetical protein
LAHAGGVLYGTELGSVTLKRVGLFCFPIKHSTHTHIEHEATWESPSAREGMTGGASGECVECFIWFFIWFFFIWFFGLQIKHSTHRSFRWVCWVFYLKKLKLKKYKYGKNTNKILFPFRWVCWVFYLKATEPSSCGQRLRDPRTSEHTFT